MATIKKHTIKLKKYFDVVEELIASAAITPGHLVELVPGVGTVRVHATAGGNVLPMFAMEDALQGKGIDEAYAALDPVQVWITGRGEIVNAILADGQHIEIGDFLQSAGNGTLTKYVDEHWHSADIGTVYPLAIVGQAIEHVDLSGSVGTHPVSGLRIQVRIV